MLKFRESPVLEKAQINVVQNKYTCLYNTSERVAVIQYYVNWTPLSSHSYAVTCSAYARNLFRAHRTCLVSGCGSNNTR